MRKFLFYFAATGWTLGLIVHLTALIGDYDLSRPIPFIWVLHIGIFVVWLPTIWELRKNQELKDFKTRLNPVTFFKAMFKNTPTWLATIGIVGSIYAIINFKLFMASQPGVPDFRDGQYILHSHGQLIKTLTEQEYYHYLANQTRGFSGHWIAFYGIAAAVLFPFNKKGKTTE
jgi:hypothetical protein